MKLNIKKWSYKKRLAIAIMLAGQIFGGCGALLGFILDFNHSFISQRMFEPVFTVTLAIMFAILGSMLTWAKRKELKK